MLCCSILCSQKTMYAFLGLQSLKIDLFLGHGRVCIPWNLFLENTFQDFANFILTFLFKNANWLKRKKNTHVLFWVGQKRVNKHLFRPNYLRVIILNILYFILYVQICFYVMIIMEDKTLELDMVCSPRSKTPIPQKTTDLTVLFLSFFNSHKSRSISLILYVFSFS